MIHGWPGCAGQYGMNMLYVTLSNIFNHFILNLFLCVCFTAHRIEIKTDDYVKFRGLPNVRWVILKIQSTLIYDEYYAQVCVL